jgi:hypothetical protein
MKAVIKIVTAEKEFTPDQIKIMKRIISVLIEHNLSVALLMKEKTGAKGRKTNEIQPFALRIIRAK